MRRDPLVNEFYAEYNLATARKHTAARQPAAHQQAALTALHTWFTTNPKPPAGGILVLPTGAGKTFTAWRFLCRGPLSQGYKVLWLAHTHHLLEQAFHSLGQDVGQIGEPKTVLRVRVASGTPGHSRVHDIKPTDDVVICTLQTLVQAQRAHHPQLRTFLNAAGEHLFVVFDEAHHAPAHSYRTLIQSLREQRPHLFLLGLTATPTYTDPAKRGWLKQIFPQGICYQATPQALLAAGVLAQPVFEEHRTDFTADFDEREYRLWQNTYQDLPESIVTQLALSRNRNTQIAETYVHHRVRYGKTIIFADRWFQCEQLGEFLRHRGVRADAIYSHVDADPGSLEARNRRTADENKRILEDFRRGELDVLINVRMLTEGTDVPDVQSVFLTRQTTSTILLTQMVGRALRGPKFGGTDKAYIVAFTDNWKHLIQWAEYDPLSVEGLADSTPGHTTAPPLQLISIDRVRALASKMDNGMLVEIAPFLTLLPIGWYRTEFNSLVADSEDQELVQHLIMAFEPEQASYEQFLAAMAQTDLQHFADESVQFLDQRPQLEAWEHQFFGADIPRLGTDRLHNLFDLVRHLAQNEETPRFFLFAERAHHDLDAVAQHYIDVEIGQRALNTELQAEYVRPDRYWKVFYPNYALFKSQHDACANRLLAVGGPETILGSGAASYTETSVDREPPLAVKEHVKRRDGYRCLCCGETNRRVLQVDHVTPSYLGGTNALENLQTLCGVCNRDKSINQIDFRHQRTLLAAPPAAFPQVRLPAEDTAPLPDAWKKFLCRALNTFYQCAAVAEIRIGERGQYFYHWEIDLYEGNDPRWITPHLAALLARIREHRQIIRKKGPDSLRLAAPGLPVVSYTIDQK